MKKIILFFIIINFNMLSAYAGWSVFDEIWSYQDQNWDTLRGSIQGKAMLSLFVIPFIILPSLSGNFVLFYFFIEGKFKRFRYLRRSQKSIAAPFFTLSRSKGD